MATNESRIGSRILWALVLVPLTALPVIWLAKIPRRLPRLGSAKMLQHSPFARNARAEVLASGLEDVRGIAVDVFGEVLLGEANGDLHRYGASGKLNTFRGEEHASKDLEQAGLAVRMLWAPRWPPALPVLWPFVLSAERATGRVALLDPAEGVMAIAQGIGGPAGVAVAGGTFFVTSDLPWPKPGELPSYESADYSRWIDKGTQRLFGAVHRCEYPGSCTPIIYDLRRPSGIAVERNGERLYVAETGANDVRWAVYRKSNGNWQAAGALGAASADGRKLPAFLGVAIDPDGKYVFAAGPNALYVFSTNGAMLGRMEFDDSVAGVACDGKYVYFVVGHQLCRLELTRVSPG